LPGILFHSLSISRHLTGITLRRDNIKLNYVALLRKRSIPTERPALVGEISANFCG
jgi:hypothetical protein